LAAQYAAGAVDAAAPRCRAASRCRAAQQGGSGRGVPASFPIAIKEAVVDIAPVDFMLQQHRPTTMLSSEQRQSSPQRHPPVPQPDPGLTSGTPPAVMPITSVITQAAACCRRRGIGKRTARRRKADRQRRANDVGSDQFDPINRTGQRNSLVRKDASQRRNRGQPCLKIA